MFTVFDDADSDDMARAKSSVDVTKVERASAELRALLKTRDAFKSRLTALSKGELNAAEMIEVAHRLLGGARHKAAKSAMTAMLQESLRLAHSIAKGASAAKTRTW